MSDIVEDVARAIEKQFHIHLTVHLDSRSAESSLRARQYAGAAITAAEPHLRRKHRQELLDELIALAQRDSDHDKPIVGHVVVTWLNNHRKEAE